MTSPATVVFGWRRSTPPLFVGGAEVSRHVLAKQLVRAGHRVAYVGSFERVDLPSISRRSELEAELSRRGVSPSQSSKGRLAYEIDGISCVAVTQRTLERELLDVCSRSQPVAVFLTQEGSADLATEIGPRWPVVGELHSTTAVGLEVARSHPRFLVAVSSYVANFCVSELGLSASVVYPAFDQPMSTATTIPRSKPDLPILMVNPIPEKGVDVLLGLARLLPGRQFVAVEAWRSACLDFRPMNLQVIPPQWSLDSLYRDASVLVVPSRIPEAYGRVITEAGFFSTPSIGIHQGGIPEAIGKGGILLRDRSPHSWREAVESCLAGSNYWALSEESRIQAQRRAPARVDDLRSLGII